MNLYALQLILLFLCVVGSAFFSIIKIVFITFRANQAIVEDELPEKSILAIEAILKDTLRFAATISLGKSASTVGTAILGVVFLMSHVPSRTPTLIFFFVIMLLALEICAYTIPHALALRYYRALAPLCIALYKSISWLLLPVVIILSTLSAIILSLVKYDKRLAFLSEEEKQRISKTEDAETHLDESEKEMIHSIFEMSETIVKEIMVPRINVTGIPITADLKNILGIIRSQGHSRMPVYKDTIDSIVGILYAKDILGWLAENKETATFTLNTVMKKPHFVPTTKKIDELMREFKHKHLHIAIVVDEYGGTAGMVTMEDILEEIVGEINDEYDVEEAEIVEVSENIYTIDPHIDLSDLEEKLSIDLGLNTPGYTTLSGLIYHEYGDIPTENGILDFRSIRIKVLKMNHQRIERVSVTVLSPKKSDNDPE